VLSSSVHHAAFIGIHSCPLPLPRWLWESSIHQAPLAEFLLPAGAAGPAFHLAAPYAGSNSPPGRLPLVVFRLAAAQPRKRTRKTP
jgi:hypothetical protein